MGKNPFAPPEHRARRREAPAQNSPAREGGVERGTEWRSEGPAQTSCAAPSALVSIVHTPRPHGRGYGLPPLRGFNPPEIRGERIWLGLCRAEYFVGHVWRFPVMEWRLQWTGISISFPGATRFGSLRNSGQTLPFSLGGAPVRCERRVHRFSTVFESDQGE
jgi:hypothetical protein